MLHKSCIYLNIYSDTLLSDTECSCFNSQVIVLKYEKFFIDSTVNSSVINSNLYEFKVFYSAKCHPISLLS